MYWRAVLASLAYGGWGSANATKHTKIPEPSEPNSRWKCVTLIDSDPWLLICFLCWVQSSQLGSSSIWKTQSHRSLAVEPNSLRQKWLYEVRNEHCLSGLCCVLDSQVVRESSDKSSGLSLNMVGLRSDPITVLSPSAARACKCLSHRTEWGPSRQAPRVLSHVGTPLMLGLGRSLQDDPRPTLTW